MEHHKKNKLTHILLMIPLLGLWSCAQQENSAGRAQKLQVVAIEPLHFHAALLHKQGQGEIDSLVHVFAEQESHASAYTQLLEAYSQSAAPAYGWQLKPYYGADFMAQFEKAAVGNVVVLAGNNQQKISYMKAAVAAGYPVFADKPLVIDHQGYMQLKALLQQAEKPLIYDMMTERYAIKNRLVRALLAQHTFSGGWKISPTGASIRYSSVHHFKKMVSGKTLVRPPLFFDTAQQGEGLVDVTTHYIDLVQWMLSPEQLVDIDRDIVFQGSTRWPTPVSEAQFMEITQTPSFPEKLAQQRLPTGELPVYANGEVRYTFKHIPVQIKVDWQVESLDGQGDQFLAEFHAEQFTMLIKPDAANVSSIFLKPGTQSLSALKAALEETLSAMPEFLGVQVLIEEEELKLLIPEQLQSPHESHFSQMLQTFAGYFHQGAVPEWETSYLLSKYYITSKALAEAQELKK